MGEEEAAELAMSPAGDGAAAAGAYMAMAWARLPAAAATDGGAAEAARRRASTPLCKHRMSERRVSALLFLRPPPQ